MRSSPCPNLYLGSRTAAWAVSEKDWRNQTCSNWLNSGNALIQHLSEKCNFRVFPFCQCIQKHKLTVKRLLIVYYIGNIIYVKKYQTPFTYCVKVIESQRWNVFWDKVYSDLWAYLYEVGLCLSVVSCVGDLLPYWETLRDRVDSHQSQMLIDISLIFIRQCSFVTICHVCV